MTTRKLVEDHLIKFGLNKDVIELLIQEEIAMCDIGPWANTGGQYSLVDGFVIPSLDINGHTTGNENILCVRENTRTLTHKYKEPPHIFFPSGVKQLIEEQDLVIITTDLLVASLAVQHGLPCVAIQGTYKWNSLENLLPTKAGGKLKKELIRDSKVTPFENILPDLLNMINTLKCSGSDLTLQSPI